MLGWIVGILVVLLSPLWYERYRDWVMEKIEEERAKGPRSDWGM